MTHTAHIVAYYWHQWKLSGGRHDFAPGSDFFGLVAGNDWFNRYHRECDASAAPGSIW